MTAKMFLNWIRNGSARLRRMQETRKTLMSSQFPGALRLKLVQVQESAPDDKIARIQGDLDLMATRIAREIDEMEMARAYAEEVIGEMSDRRQREVLTLYYLHTYTLHEEVGKTHLVMERQVPLSWYDVASEMHMPVRKVHVLHRVALENFEGLAVCLPERLP